MVLFVGELPVESEYLVWDLFLVKGDVVMFRVALTILKLMEEEIIADDSYDNIMIVIATFCKERVTRKAILKNLAPGIHLTEI